MFSLLGTCHLKNALTVTASMLDDIGMAAVTGPLNLGCYCNEEMYAIVDQIVDLNKSLLDISEKHFHVPAKWFYTYKIQSSQNMYIYYPPSVYWYGEKSSCPTLNDHQKGCTKGRQFMTLCDGCHQSHCLEILINQDSVRSIVGSLYIFLCLLLAWNAISSPKVMKPSKISNTCTEILRRKTLVVDTMECLCSYTRAFDFFRAPFGFARSRTLCQQGFCNIS